MFCCYVCGMLVRDSSWLSILMGILESCFEEEDGLENLPKGKSVTLNRLDKLSGYGPR